MKVLMVSDAGSIHTERWTAALKDAGVDVVLFSITPVPDGFYEEKSVKVYFFNLFGYKKKKNPAVFSRFFSHSRAVSYLKKVISSEKPDILHAHYATSYGLVAALSGFHPFIQSFWGSDVYEFPKLSRLNRLALGYILKKADRVLSTGRAMAAEIGKYYKGSVGITPFGVDTDVFCPAIRVTCGQTGESGSRIVFGTVKTLSYRYGMDILIRAFARMRRELPGRWTGKGKVPQTELVIAGKGPDADKLKRMAESEGVGAHVVFRGPVEHELVPEVYAGMDVAVFLSREESFGVAAVEAMSCCVPVIASDADGFREVLEGGVGLVVPREDAAAASEAMLRMVLEPELRERMGKAGRQKVLECYQWKENVAAMTDEYRKVLGIHNGYSPDSAVPDDANSSDRH